MFKKGRYRLPLWLRRTRDVGFQFIVPLTIFQLIRTVFFPTTVDVAILAVLVILYLTYIAGVL